MFFSRRRKAPVIFFCSFLFFFSILYAQEYRITAVDYDIKGLTREYALAKEIPVDTERLFPDLTALEQYLQHLLTQFKNQRILEDASIAPFLGNETFEGFIPVRLLISTKDTWNIIVLPYPKYDSNSGFIFKVKIKDFNFLGSMRTLSGDVAYEYEEGKTHPHKLGASVSFEFPFKIGRPDLTWINSLAVSYNIGNRAVHTDFKTGIDFTLPLHKNIAFKFGVSQGIAYNPDYKEAHDAFYLSEAAYIGLPITAAKTERLGDILWTPTAAIEWNWDPKEITSKNDGIIHKDLKGPDISFKHGISASRIDWIGNYRRGYSAGASQSLVYDTFFKTYTTSYTLSGEFYYIFKYAGFASKAYFFKTFGERSEEGARIRGVRDAYILTDSALFINIDVPIKVWQTDWRALGAPDWTKWLDFEMQISPFFDFALGDNPAAGSYYHMKDAWYAAGLEIIGFPNKMRSVQGRISFGIDGVLAGKKIGEKSDGINKIINKLFHTSWRTGLWYELSIGIGLHY